MNIQAVIQRIKELEVEAKETNEQYVDDLDESGTGGFWDLSAEFTARAFPEHTNESEAFQDDLYSALWNIYKAK